MLILCFYELAVAVAVIVMLPITCSMLITPVLALYTELVMSVGLSGVAVLSSHWNIVTVTEDKVYPVSALMVVS